MTDLGNSLEKILKFYLRNAVTDLALCEAQTICTTKHERRERALAYLLENITGEHNKYPSEDFVQEFLGIVKALLPRMRSQEAKTGLERTEKRLRYALMNEEECIAGSQTCVACNERYQAGTSHECTNKRAQTRDRIMTQDDSIQETSD